MPSNFYEHEYGQLTDAVYAAAFNLMENGFQVIPLEKGKKNPANGIRPYNIISRPIHKENFDFFFKERDVDLGIIIDHNLEFIDIDPKNKPGVTEKVLKAIRAGWPELYEKLVIDKTPSGGVHIIYRAEITGGPVALAKVNASPNPLTIIERISRNNKQYIKISPSLNYQLLQGNPFTIADISAEERNFICAVCASFNEVYVPEVKKKEAEREDSPWSVFNATHDWVWTMNMLIERNWVHYKDDSDRVYMRRPGDTNQQYSGVIFKGSNILYLFTPSTEFQNEKGYTPFGVYNILVHGGDTAAACRQLASENCGVNIFDEGQFWKRERGKIKIKYTDLLSWYHTIGYRKYNEQIVQVIDSVVDISGESQMKIAFLNEVEFEVKDEMFEKVATIFSDKGGLMAMLQELPDNFIRDDRDYTWIFFKNAAVKISATGPEMISYRTLTGYIWKSEIIDREFYTMDETGCDGSKFVAILGGDRYESLQKIIGFLMSRFKDALNPRAAVIMEDIEAEQEGESQGGSGKGLCVQFVTQYRKTTIFDGKNFRFSDPFLFQNVDLDTCIYWIDDTERNFKFKGLYSMLTGSLLVNKKNKHQVIIPFCRSGKFVITSNYSVGDMDASSRRRKYEFPVVKHFGESLDPIQEFGREFFAGWDREEWLRFDNFIALCCQRYIAETDKKSIGVTTGNSAERSLMANTNREFLDYMDGQLKVNFFDFAPAVLKRVRGYLSDGSYTTNAVDVQFYSMHRTDPDYYFTVDRDAFMHQVIKMTNYRALTSTRLTGWIKNWAKARNVLVDTLYKRSSDGNRMYRFEAWEYNFMATSTENQSWNGDIPKLEQEIPF
jgi:hypothetical protein